MKIKLIRTGGFIPVTKSAEADINISEQEAFRLIEAIQSDPANRRIADGNIYELTIGNNSVTVDMEKVPEEYRELFTSLKRELKIVKGQF